MKELGNISSCHNPKRVINPYTNEVVFAECRKCSACLNKRSMSWKVRVQKECEYHRYSMFVTLTYNNENIPIYSYDGSGTWLSNRDEIGEFDLVEDDYRGVDFISIPISKSNITNSFAYCHKRDVINFFKRFRSNIDYHFKKNNIKENGKIRYFVCSEYGPRTLRPHYHAIIWFDSEEICRLFGEFLFKSWSYGHTDFSLVNSSAPSYVAKYITGNYNLPSVLQLKYTKPFHLSSKNPCIGYNERYEKELFENVVNGTYGLYELDRASQMYLHVPTPRTLESRCLPKCREYRFISYSKKLRIYSYTFDVFKKYGDKDLAFSASRSYFDSAVDLHCSYACFKWCLRYNWTPEQYLQGLDDYYSRKSLYQLGLQYEYQQRYIGEYGLPISHLLDFDPTIYERLPLYEYQFRDKSFSGVRNIFLSYGVTSSDLYSFGMLDRIKLYELSQKSSSFYERNVLRNRKILFDSFKNKVLNETINNELFL